MTDARLPPGVRDYLPVAAARRARVIEAMRGELARWGYRAVVTPLYEYDQVLARGLAGARATRFVEPGSGEILALRPDLTPQVARLVATRMHDEPGPLRLAYEGSVVRDGRELFQVGAELIDAPGPRGDLEAISLCEAALGAAGVTGLRIDLGHADVVRGALDGLGLDEAGEVALHAALQKKDAAAVAAWTRQARLAAPRRRLLAALPSLYGGVEVIERARRVIAARSAAGRALDELARLVERLAALGPVARLSIDLGEVRGFRYYTGTRFAVYTDGAGSALASGGRYDDVAARYGRKARATGFAVDVDAVAELLRRRGVAAPAASPAWYVAGDAVRVLALAARLRAGGRRVVVDLDEPLPNDAALRERARRHGAARVLVAGRRARWFAVEGRGRGALDETDLDALDT